METKHYVFLAAVLFGVPLGVAFVGRARRRLDACVFVLVLGIVRYDLVTINFVSREWYRGTTRGIEFCWLDLLWMVVLGHQLRARRRPARTPHGLGAMLAFVAYNALNVVVSDPAVFGVFELSKMIRGVLVFLTIAAYVESERELRLIVSALAVGTTVEWLAALYTRVALGHPRAEGTFAHPNSLSMYNVIAAPVLLAVALSDVTPRVRRLAGVAAMLGATAVLFTISRSGIATMALVLAGVGATCGSLTITPKKVAVAAFALVVGTIAVAKTWGSIQERFATEGGFEKEYGGKANEGRGVYLNLAHLIVGERSLGCGLNNWSYCVSNRYGEMLDLHYIPYAGTEEAPPRRRVQANAHIDAPQAPPAHSLYAITLGETGWPGVVLFGLVWAQWLRMTGSFLRGRTSAFRSRLGVGVFFGMVGALAQSFTEWELRQTPLLFLVHVLLGTAAAFHRVSARAPAALHAVTAVLGAAPPRGP